LNKESPILRAVDKLNNLLLGLGDNGFGWVDLRVQHRRPFRTTFAILNNSPVPGGYRGLVHRLSRIASGTADPASQTLANRLNFGLGGLATERKPNQRRRLFGRTAHGQEDMRRRYRSR
jgi:hypothetical protein